MEFAEYANGLTLKIAVIAKGEYFLDYRTALVRAIRSHGFEAEGFDSIEYDYRPDGFLIINPLMYQNINKRYWQFMYGAIQTEQLPSSEGGGFAFTLPKLIALKKYAKEFDFIFEWSPSVFRDFQKKFEHFYLMYHGTYDEIQWKIQKSEDVKHKYDVCFIGDPTGIGRRREKMIEMISKKFNLYPKFTGLWGQEKKIAISQSAICLNIHFDHAFSFESPRIYEFLSNKAFVLTEKIADSFPFNDGHDYASFYYGQCIDRIEVLLEDASLRDKISEQGYRTAMMHGLDRTSQVLINCFLNEKYFRESRKYKIKSILFHKTGMKKTFYP